MDKRLLKFYEQKYKSKISSTVGRADKLGNKIEVKLSLDEFIRLYQDAGVFPMRPYVISRVNDIGHYEIGNVFISTNMQNSLEAHGIYDEDSAMLTRYCHVFKYRRQIVKNAMKKGRITWEQIYLLEPIK